MVTPFFLTGSHKVLPSPGVMNCLTLFRRNLRV